MLLLAKLLVMKDSLEANYRDYLTADRNFNVDRITLDQNQYQFEQLTNTKRIDDSIEKSHLEVINAVNLYCRNIDTLLDFARSEIKREHEQYCQTVNSLLAEIDSKIKQLQDKFLNSDTPLSANEYENPVDSIISSHERVESVDDLIKSQIVKYVDWHYPGLIFRPINSVCVDDMVGFDPLYLVDHNQTYLEPITEKFNEVYQRRLRYYTIDDRTADPILTKLPQGQFGCVVAHNFFNYKKYSTVCRYLTEVFDLLKPGGVFIFTFNDCDYIKAIELVETRKATYVPGSMIKQQATELGYKIIHYESTDDQTTCIELLKPGTLTSLRGGQTLGRIVPN